MNDIFEPFYSDAVRKIVMQNDQVLEQLKKRRKESLSEKVSLIFTRQIQLSNNLALNSGDIILRPIKNLKSDWGLDLNHYGIVLGTTSFNEKLVLEITSEKNVQIISLSSFLDGRNINEISYKRKPNDTSFETIIERAKELQFESYMVTQLNCRHFVEYCVYGKRESKAVQNIANIMTPILDITSLYLDYKACFHDEKGKKTIYDFRLKIKEISNNIKNLK